MSTYRKEQICEEEKIFHCTTGTTHDLIDDSLVINISRHTPTFD